MYSIGEFSMVSGIPVRTLRFYHEVGLLIPASVDEHSNYRYYDERNVETAKVIVALRGLEFSLEEVGEILAQCRDDTDIVEQLLKQKQTLSGKIRHYQTLLGTIDQFVEKDRRQREDAKLLSNTALVVEREIEPLRVAGIRMKGRYSDCGKGFATLGKRLGRYIAGKPLCLFYDGEYRETDADFETCMPVRNGFAAPDDILVRELPAVRCATYLHRGPYDELKNSYARLLRYVNQQGYKLALPTREVYLKGPGMIFKGNPRNYLTEIQIPFEKK
jgi:DNA-binding transcriptional MerR regulator/effector-binding domain-containing protein